jgi:hypothetical protein
MDIQKLNSKLPITTRLDYLNDFIIQLNGLVESGKFDVNELTQLFEDIPELNRKFKRNISLGNTLLDYTGWTHVHAESGYSIWKYAPDDFLNDSLNRLYFDNKIVEARGSAQSESISAFDSVFLYNGGDATYTDNSTEASTDNGTSFELMDATNDYLYIGSASQFAGTTFEFDLRGADYTLVLQYWNGSTWNTLTEDDNDLVDDTQNWLGNGRITWSIPADWSTISVNGQTKYWIRFSTSTTPVTTALAFLVVPISSVIALLSLSSDEFFKEEWAWCSFNNYVYVTIKNTGTSSYEGNAFVTSSSSVANKKNFFIYNHEFKLDYRNINYSTQTSSLTKNGVVNIGDCVYVYDSNTIASANSDSTSKITVGICINNVDGEISIKNWGKCRYVNTVGLGDIVAGDKLYLSTTDGCVTKDIAESGATMLQVIGIALSDEDVATDTVDAMLSINYNPIEL